MNIIKMIQCIFIEVAKDTKCSNKPERIKSFSYILLRKHVKALWCRPVARGGGRGSRPTPPPFRVRSGEPRSRCTIAPGFPRVVRVSHALYYRSGLPRALKRAVRARILWCMRARPCEGGVAWRCGPCWAKNDPSIMETWLRACGVRLVKNSPPGCHTPKLPVWLLRNQGTRQSKAARTQHD